MDEMKMFRKLSEVRNKLEHLTESETIKEEGSIGILFAIVKDILKEEKE